METSTTPAPDLTSLRDGFEGTILTPDDSAYADARAVNNSMIDKQPAVIAQCASKADVAAAVGFARNHDLELAIRSGGHSAAGTGLSDGGLVIDMRSLNAVAIDPDARTATVGGGALWRDVDAACEGHGLAVTGGRVSTTGVAGLSLGGGSGWLERRYGLSSDSLESVELVTAAGETIHASADQHPDLFWALHGGGGNFGVATELVFRLHALEQATFVLLLFEGGRGREGIRVYRDLVEASGEDDPVPGVIYLTGPPEEFVPEELQGKLCFAIAGIYPGTEAEAREAWAPILELGPTGEVVAEMPYSEAQCAIDDPPGFRNYWSAEHLGSLPDEAIELFCAQGEAMLVPSPSQHLLVAWGGEVARGRGDYPQPHRDALWVVHPFGLWDDPADDDRVISWVRRCCADLKPFATGAVYLNFVGDEGADRVAAGFGEENYRRLREIKTKYDPDNAFHLNQNIPPA